MGKGGGRSGGRKGAGKKRKNVWDDEQPAGDGKGDSRSGKGTRPEKRRESMMSQWKKRKVAEHVQRRAFEGSVADRKQRQREQLEDERRRLAARAFEEKAARLAAQPKSKGGRKKKKPRRRRKKKVEGSESESESESEEETRKPRGSLFDQFVQTFQPSGVADSDEEEEEEEEQYERVLVDEDGNEIEEDDEEEEEEEESAELVEAAAAAEEEEEEELQEDGEEEAEQPQDPYRRRFQLATFMAQDAKALDATPRKFSTVSRDEWPSEYIVSLRPGVAGASTEEEDGESGLRSIRARLRDAWRQKGADADALWPRGSVERALFDNLLAYRDVLFAAQTLGNTRALRRMSAMHVLNHVLKARDTVTRNNERIRKRSVRGDNEDEDATEQEQEQEDKEYRDQGFCRASVLVLLPLRSAAVAFVQLLLELLPPAVDTFHNKDRFFDEYGTVSEDAGDAEDDEGDEQKEWQRVFAAGNNDDCFQIGLSLSRRAMRFYSEYHHADVILASPLGLRQSLGDELAELDDAGDDGEQKKLSTDVLSSIEVCVVDSASLIAMQNVDHLRAVLRAVNAPPKEAPHADFSRLREWNLSFLGAYFRQTVVFAHGVEPLLNALVTKSCRNMAGCLRVARAYDAADGSASISRVVPRVQQIFQRIDADADAKALRAADEAELRFAYFRKHVFEPLLDRPRKHVLVFIPSYLDYVRVRNLFNEREHRKLLSCLQICEYTPNRQVARARTAFFHGRCHVLLVTERFHFYHQFRLRGIQQLVWYAPPAMGDFYPEVLNMLPGSAGSAAAGSDDDDEGDDDEEEQDEAGKSSIALFSRLDLFRLQRVVGNKRAERMCRPKAPKPTFLFR